MNALAAALPPMSTTTILERYMLFVLALLCLHLLEFSIVNFSMRRAREFKDVKSDEEVDDSARSMSMSMSVQKSIHIYQNAFLQRVDSFSIRCLNRSLNMHTRWVSLVIFII